MSKPSSDRSFGFVFAVFFALVGVSSLRHSAPVRIWAIAVAAVFLILALARPQLLHPLNVVWYGFGLLLNKIVQPIITAILFFAAIVPTGFILRLMGKDVLQLSRDPAARSYWKERQPPGPPPSSMSHQF